jgi:hypothetical protein
MVTRSILEPISTLVDVVSPDGKTLSVSVEGIPPSTAPKIVLPSGKGIPDPAASAPD